MCACRYMIYHKVLMKFPRVHDDAVLLKASRDVLSGRGHVDILPNASLPQTK